MLIRSNGQLTTDRNGNPKSALCLKSGFASVPPGVYFDPATGGFTFMAWVKVNSYNNWQRIFDFGHGQNENIILAFRDRDNKPLLGTKSGGLTRTDTFKTVINLNSWYHIAVSVTARASSFYVDGVRSGGGSG